MSKQQRIIWTGLPNGILKTASGSFLKLSVHISPRLYNSNPAATDLNAYPDFKRWAALVSALHFQVTFTGGGGSKSLPAKVDTRDPKLHPVADMGYYGALFTGATPVTPYAFEDLSRRFIVSYPARQIQDYLQSAYPQIGTIFDEEIGDGLVPSSDILNRLNPPPATTANLAGPFDVWNDDLFARGSFRSRLLQKYGQQGAVVTGPPDSLQQNGSRPRAPRTATLPSYANTAERFGELKYFHYRDGNKQDPSKAGQAPGQQEPDFHQALSALNKYPRLMRYLGFVVDLLVPLDPSIPVSADARLQVASSFTSSTVPGNPIRPFTHYVLESSTFAARSNGGIAHGMLDLTNELTYGLSQIDVDGGGLKLAHAVSSLGRSRQYYTIGVPRNAGLPSLRSAGISLLQSGRAVGLATIFKTAKTRNTAAESGSDPDMYAEDLTLGYRVDVLDSISGKWHSLLRRTATYQFFNAPATKQKLVVDDEEGFVSLGATQNPADTSAHPDLYLHESLFRWNGWSLAVPMPGKAIGDGDEVILPNRDPGHNFKLRVDFTDGGTYSSYRNLQLPRLRFGRGYRLRARVVDLAGNSAPPDSTLAAYASPPPGHDPFTYLRFEPVAHPTVVLHDDTSKSPGEAVHRMVIRSDYKVSSDNYPAVEKTYGLSNASKLNFLPVSKRHVFPPKSSEEMAERHGKFDQSGSVVISPGAYDNIDNKGKGFAQLDGNLDAADGTGGSIQGEGAPITTDNEMGIQVPYIADVLARGVAIDGLPGYTPPSPPSPPTPYLRFDGWPFARPFRIELHGLMKPDPLNVDPQQAPSWDAANRVLKVFLAQGDRQGLRLSSFFNPPDLNLLGMWKWILNYYAPDPPPDFVKNTALSAAFWMLTPWVDVELVHAVQRPLVVPQFGHVRAQKDHIGQTDALLVNVNFAIENIHEIPVPVHGQTTMKLDVYGQWKIPIDDGIDPSGYYDQYGHDHVFEVPVNDFDTGVSIGVNDNRRHRFHDTKYRQVDYTAVATTRFRDYFDFTDADIKSGKAVITQTSVPARTAVFNSARPDAPRVLYVVPAFEWSTQQPTGNQTVSRRTGGWLRVWMDRPWYSSGDGEQLGVVLMQLNDSSAKRDAKPSAISRIAARLGVGPKLVEVPDYMKAYVTQWGRDLVHDNAEIDGSPTGNAFPHKAITSRDALTLAEVPGTGVGVAAHDVHFDTGRQLWYADIQMDGGDAYFPFVRLALARFQPNSIPDAHLSRVIQADFVQLAPDRFATIQTRDVANDPRHVTVNVTGPSYSVFKLNSRGPGTSMEVVLEQQQAGAEGDLAWVPVPNATYECTGSIPNPDSPYEYLWTTEFDTPRPIGTVPYRIIVKEYETWVHTPGIIGITGSDAQPTYEKRIVYATSVEL